MTGTEAILILDKMEYQLKLKLNVRKSNLEAIILVETESGIYMMATVHWHGFGSVVSTKALGGVIHPKISNADGKVERVSCRNLAEKAANEIKGIAKFSLFDKTSKTSYVKH